MKLKFLGDWGQFFAAARHARHATNCRCEVCMITLGLLQPLFVDPDNKDQPLNVDQLQEAVQARLDIIPADGWNRDN